MTPIKCEYCGANNDTALECRMCGAPLPLQHPRVPLRGISVEYPERFWLTTDGSEAVQTATDEVFLPPRFIDCCFR